jgi:DNA-binding response OmpR family regulator
MLGDRELAITAGFDSYITKPINLNEVRKHAEQLTAGSDHPQD